MSVSPNGINCSISFSIKTFGQLNTDKYLYLKTFVVLWTKGQKNEVIYLNNLELRQIIIDFFDKNYYKESKSVENVNKRHTVELHGTHSMCSSSFDVSSL